ncbi:MAG: rRNA pseudouridine synthase [Bacteroidales bacterium]|nr:rRNA pseudouridine synthase [Bacteroidales bacterium]MBN2755764.1 rRNA pseudouridine synthase [Bacteroidales bacterium]
MKDNRDDNKRNKPFKKYSDSDKKSFPRKKFSKSSDSDNKDESKPYKKYSDSDNKKSFSKKKFSKDFDSDKKETRPFKKYGDSDNKKPYSGKKYGKDSDFEEKGSSNPSRKYNDSDNKKSFSKKKFSKDFDSDKKETRPFKKYGDSDNKKPYSGKKYGKDSDFEEKGSSNYPKKYSDSNDKKSFSKKKFSKDYDSDKKETRPFKKYGDSDNKKPYSGKKYGKDSGFEEKGNSNYPKKYSDSGKKKSFAKKEYSAEPEAIMSEAPIRLNKFISISGICSRREADELIKSRKVQVNGVIVDELGTKVSLKDEVIVKGENVLPEKKVYILLNKPKDFISTLDDPHAEKTVIDLIKGACPERVYPVGRLDRNTTGVLLLTNDGDLTKKLTHPKFEKKKIYQVTLDKPVTKLHLSEIEEGIELEDGFINADAISFTDDSKKEIGIELHSGKNRIVRRIFEHFDYKVTKLDRVYFAGLTKKGVQRGRWRFLNDKEISMLKRGAYE